MAGAIYSMAADDHIRWRIRLECQRVGCTKHTTVFWCAWNERIEHGGESYAITSGPYESAWEGLVGWLDTQHARLIVDGTAERAYPDASLT